MMKFCIAPDEDTASIAKRAQYFCDLVDRLERELATKTVYAELNLSALRKIAERKPYAANGGTACAACGTYWHPDPAVYKFHAEHHHDRCAYAIACAALAKNPNPSGQVAAEPSPARSGDADPAVTNEDSGPVGLGPVEGVHRYQHVKRGTFYTGLFAAELQTETPLGDGAMLHIYRGDDGQIWARSMSEFNDGRFKLVETLSAGDSK